MSEQLQIGKRATTGGAMNYAVEPSDAAGMSARRLERIRPAMQAYVDRGVFAGINTLIARRGKVVHAGEFGWRDKEAGSAMTADTIFRLYSMTKPIVCVGLMTLLEEGRFRLIDPVARYIPAFAAVKVREDDGRLVNPVRPVMVRDVMSHTSGLTYHFVDESPIGRMYDGAKLFDAGAADRGDFRAPARPIPARTPVRAVGHDRHRLRGPAREAEPSGRDVWPSRRDRCRRDGAHRTRGMGQGHQRSHRRVEDLSGRSRTCSCAAATVCLARDYFRFAQMLANGGELDGARVIGRKTLELMHSNAVPTALLPLDIGGLPLPGYGFGLGSRVLMDVAQSGVPGSAGEFGWSGAAKTYYWVDPKEELVGLFMTQSMMSFDLPELDLRALAYQAIED
jgi:CubicO group peptidase (beta-lactamase class C family)